MAAQREALGLPAREVLAQSAVQAWQTTLTLPQLDVLWRTQERGEALLPSAWVQAFTKKDMNPNLTPWVFSKVSL